MNITARFSYFFTRAFLQSPRRNSQNGSVEVAFTGSVSGDATVRSFPFALRRPESADETRFPHFAYQRTPLVEIQLVVRVCQNWRGLVWELEPRLR